MGNTSMENDVEQQRAHLDVARLRSEFQGNYHLLTTSDGITLFIQEWPSPTPSDVAVMIFHGITAYSGVYSKIIAEELNQAGYNVLGMNLRGHGLSDGVRGDYPSAKRAILDICEAIAFAKEKYPRLVVLGHSLGAVQVALAANHCMEKIDGIIISSAAKTIRPGVYKKPTAGQTAKILFAALFTPGKRVMKYYREGMTGVDDPLFNFAYSPRFMTTFSTKKFTLPAEVSCPVLFTVGENDELFSQESVKETLDGINAKDKTMIVIPGGKHAVFPPGSWTDLIGWLNTRFPLG